MMVDGYGMRLVVIGIAIETCYCFYKFDFYRSD